MTSLFRIALCATLINAFVPTISYLLASSSGRQVVELCTSFGAKKVVIDVGGVAGAAGHRNISHCQFCLANQDATAIGGGAKLAPAKVFVAGLGFTPVIAGHTPPAYWKQSRPRAPPSLLS